MTPEDFPGIWEGHRYDLRKPKGATHQAGRTLDWFVCSSSLGEGSVSTEQLPRADHLAVTTSIGAVCDLGLGVGLRTPRAFRPEALAELRERPGWDAQALDPGVQDWESFTTAAEELLTAAQGLSGPEYVGRGVAPRLQKLRVSRPQAVGTGLNRQYCAMWLARSRRGRLAELLRLGRGRCREARQLRARTEGVPEFSADLLGRWEAAIRRQRRHRWLSWATAQRARGGGGVFKWMQRLGPELGMAALLPGGSNAERVEQGWAEWSSLWAEGAPVANAGERGGPPLTPIQPGQLRSALLRMSTRKSKGADGWGPHELGTLPAPYLARLCSLFFRAGSRTERGRKG